MTEWISAQDAFKWCCDNGSYNSAKKDLGDWLASGLLASRGIRLGASQTEKIHSAFWCNPAQSVGWSSGVFTLMAYKRSYLDDPIQRTFHSVEFDWQALRTLRPPNDWIAKARNRVPSVKTGYPPPDDVILAKAEELHAQGFTAKQLASEIPKLPGFENALTTHVRDLVRGHWKPTGRPKKTRP